MVTFGTTVTFGTLDGQMDGCVGCLGESVVGNTLFC